jgi:hypothetical protein
LLRRLLVYTRLACNTSRQAPGHLNQEIRQTRPIIESSRVYLETPPLRLTSRRTALLEQPNPTSKKSKVINQTMLNQCVLITQEHHFNLFLSLPHYFLNTIRQSCGNWQREAQASPTYKCCPANTMAGAKCNDYMGVTVGRSCHAFSHATQCTAIVQPAARPEPHRAGRGMCQATGHHARVHEPNLRPT